jgi:hypothetical protein
MVLLAVNASSCSKAGVLLCFAQEQRQSLGQNPSQTSICTRNEASTLPSKEKRGLCRDACVSTLHIPELFLIIIIKLTKQSKIKAGVSLGEDGDRSEA